MTPFLMQRIKARELKIEKINRQVRELIRERRGLEAEMKAYLDVLENRDHNVSLESQNNLDPYQLENDNLRASKLSDTWKGILNALVERYPLPSHSSEILSIVKDLEKEMSYEALRSQLSVYTKKGRLERTGTAMYLITDVGASLVGKNLSFEKQEILDNN